MLMTLIREDRIETQNYQSHKEARVKIDGLEGHKGE